ncbi:hypothetical protein B9T26_13445 [Acinetobacter sp. ANC 4169]|uniref:TonB-dependent receptor plug domain-containing protein n=1 Tax=Acinetobacter sp. ANC 4169 TaxID=1977879 RepID=UPI000A3321C6|nr:TonB-dependent receptor plug domain-containing protein [Acinetobacter sp. ANC 4169]OTG70743.1 hypothetical protein B9T26_13445 [Acinetobacter sp. ANC 4169]
MRCSPLHLAIGLTLSNLGYASEATPANTNQDESHKFALPKIVLEAVQTPEAGQTVYTEEKLKRLSSTNKTISEVLQLHPNVQFSQNSMAAATQGEIKADDFSINGAMVYDNNILLDNISLNNVLNPASNNSDFGMTGMSGSSIATTINTDLLCELFVFDSNVSAEYGDFMGGVVKAKSCTPKTAVNELHGQITYDYTSNDWTNANHIDENDIASYEKDSSDLYQKAFSKQGISAELYGNLNERVGMSLSLSKRQSDIDVKSLLVDTETAQSQLENDTAQLNIYAKLNQQHQLKLGLQLQNDQKSLDQYNVKDGHVDLSSKNNAFELELSSQLQQAKITQSLVYQQQEMNRDSADNEMLVWKSSEAKNWSTLSTATEGGYGDQSQNLNSLEYKIKSEFKPFQWAAAEHKLMLGAGYSHHEADWQRLEHVYNYFVPSNKDKTNCINNNNEMDAYCDPTYNNQQGQYHSTRVGLDAGTITVRDDRAHVFIEDAIKLNNYYQFRLGMRADYDSLNGEILFAPRSILQYRPFADERLRITTGWNRYYANKLFAYHLQDGINSLSYKETRKSINDEWGNRSAYSSSNVKSSDLATPFVDESVLALDSRLGIFDAQLKYVHRNFEDQIRKNRISTGPIVDEYDNLGRMTANTYTLSLSNHQAIPWKASQHYFVFGFDYTDKTSNFTDYDDGLLPLNYQQYILYDGKMIDESTRPASNFNRPWTARLGWNIDFDHIPLKLSNQLRLRSGYEAMVSSTIPLNQRPTGPDGELIKTRYDATSIASAFTWDMRASYDVPIVNDSKLIFGLSVKNVTNKNNHYTLENKSTLHAESGRQFIADVSFKF